MANLLMLQCVQGSNILQWTKWSSHWRTKSYL